MNKKIGILLPDGVGMRNFLYGKLIDGLYEKNCEVFVFHFLPEQIEALIPQELLGKVSIIKLPESREGFKAMLYRQAKVFGQLYNRMSEDNSQVVLDMQFRHKPKRWKARLMHKWVHFLAKKNSNIKKLQKLDAKHKAAVTDNISIKNYQDILGTHQIEVLLCTHQRASKAVPVIEAANLLKIPTATFIYSWDNLPKGRMAVMPQYYFVWSSFMKSQMETYYPEIDPKRIIITGTPQFEPYFESNKIWERAFFFEKMGLDMNRPLVCYSGDDELTSPFDEYYLRDIAASFREIPEKERPQLIFRACPVDHSGRFDWVLEQYPEIVSSSPLWKSFSGNWTQILPTFQDLELLVNVTLHSDAVVNVASTMCFDFALFDKPGVFINYNQQVTSEKEPYYNLKRGYQFPHFKPVHELQPVYWLNDKKEITHLFTHIFSNKQEKKEARKLWVQQMLDGMPNGSSTRMVDQLIHLNNE